MGVWVTLGARVLVSSPPPPPPSPLSPPLAWLTDLHFSALSPPFPCSLLLLLLPPLPLSPFPLAHLPRILFLVVLLFVFLLINNLFPLPSPLLPLLPPSLRRFLSPSVPSLPSLPPLLPPTRPPSSPSCESVTQCCPSLCPSLLIPLPHPSVPPDIPYYAFHPFLFLSLSLPLYIV